MTIEQVIAMIERRGYEVYRYPPPPATFAPRRPLSIGLAILHRASLQYVRWELMPQLFSELPSTPKVWRKLVEQELVPLSHGQHHMQCRCGTPVLRQYVERPKPFARLEVANGEIYDTPGGGISLPYFVPDIALVYRMAAAGPMSEPITGCPTCGAKLSESVQEINDEVMVE